ncbi:MAG: AsmA-like C-terminal region-containing protein, partial [Caldimonas sp.]
MSAYPPPDAAALPRRLAPRASRFVRLRWMARTLLWLIVAAWTLLFVGWLSLHWLILPHIEEWRVPIETRASRMLGAPVRIGAITVRSSGWVPSIELRDVRVLDAEQRVALSLPRVFAAFSVRSLLALEPRFEQLLIDGASLDIRRDASGHIRVAGLDFGSNRPDVADDSNAADWFFTQREFVIRGGTLRWIDELRQAPPLVLGDVEFVVRNGFSGHTLRLDATPPPGWGERFSLRGRFTQPLFARSGDWRHWSGSAYADLPRADVRELRQHVSLPFELSEGDGALRAWFDVNDGEPSSATVDVSLRAVALRLDKSVEPLEFEQIEGRITAEKTGERIAVAVHRFGFVTGDGLRWPQGDLNVAWRQKDGGEVTGGEFDAERLDVGVMAQIATRVPLGTALRELLADVHPQGVITHLATQWQGPLDAPERYRVKGLLSGLSLAARPGPQSDAIGRPGLSNAAVQLDASEGGGEAQIGISAGILDLPGVFAERALSLDRLDAKLAWKIEPGGRGEAPKISVKVSDAHFANADAKGELTASWRTGHGSGVARGGRYPGELELDGRLADADASRTVLYLPLGLPDSVRSYLGRAIRAGTITSATFRVRGDLWDFPFHDAKTARDGEFRIAAKVDGLTFAYIPGETADFAAPVWPVFTGAAGELVVDRSSFEIRDTRARISGVDFSHIHGRIAELGDRARLEIEGTARGPLTEMLRFVNTTPVGRWTGRVLAGASATGPADLKLALGVPLGAPDQTRVQGSLLLAGNDVRVTPETPLLGAAKARIEFTQKGFTVAGASAHVLGGEVAFEGGSSAGLNGGDTQRFSGQGTASAEALRQTPELGTLARIASAMSGQASYRATLAFVGGHPQVNVASNLVGLAVDLPAPFGKSAAAPVALRVRTGPEDAAAPGAADPAAPLREALQVELGNVLQAHFVRELVGDSVRVVRGAIRINDPMPAPTPAATTRVAEPTLLTAAEALALPANGVGATITLKRLDVDAWRAAATRLEGDPGRTEPQAAPFVFDASGGFGYLPDAIGLRVGDLATGTRRLGNVTAGLSQQGGLWRANVDSDQLDGYVEYRPSRRGTGAGRVYARLSRLSLPKGEEEHVESLLDEQPASIPALDIVVDDFELRGKRLGRLEIEAANRGGGRDTAREWQLSKLNLVMPEAQLSASGTWGAPGVGPTTATGASAPVAAANPPRRAAMNFTLALADSGALLERLGMGRVVRGGKGSLTGDVSWLGSPLSPDFARMTGQVKVAIDSGQFLKASAGAARLLGVLSLQSLPRRLLLDFRDLFEEGFAFDNVVGDVRIGQGQASTNNLRMRGAAAAVLMEGSADLERETEDLRVVVVPEINAGTASLAYAVINPAIGLGTFLAQYFLRRPLIAANTREFRVTGPWDDPKVERVERSLLG